MPRKSSSKPLLVGISNASNRPQVRNLDEVYEHIFSSIVDQRLPPGTKLNELTLCDIFNVGRRQISQILTRLSQDKVVTLLANRGAFVTAPDVAEARMIFEARRVLEGEITRMVAEKATSDLLAPLRENVAAESSFRRQGRLREAIRVSGEFHILLGTLSKNDILAGMVRQLVARTSLVVSLYENQTSMICWHDDHGAFINLLAARRASAAVKSMHAHLSHVEESLNFDRPAQGPLDLRRIYAPDA